MPVPPPALVGADAFEAIEPDASAWVARTVIFGYSAGPQGAKDFGDGSMPTSGPRIEPDDEN